MAEKKNKVVCAWCGAVLKDGEEPISHGICELCSEKVLKTLRRSA